MKAKVVLLTYLYFSRFINQGIPDNKGEFADILLLRSLHRLNRYIKPDLVFIAGDIINKPDGENSRELLGEIKKIIDLIHAPTIIVSGNHAPDKDVFESIIGKQPDFFDINGVRFVPFFDSDAPDHNALRIDAELTRMHKLGAEFNGPLVSLQHAPLFPPNAESCVYNYTNANKIIEIMQETNYVLALSGHCHKGFELLDYDGKSYIAGQSLCEKPFSYAIIEIDEKGKVSCEQETLAMPDELRLVDHHVHTKLAYCNENMDICKSIALGKAFGLDGIVISEHSAHLYFNKDKNYRYRLHYLEGIKSEKKDDRVAEYFSLYENEADDFCSLGMEIDYDQEGHGIIESHIYDKLEFTNGAIHILNTTENPDKKAIEKEFLFLTEAIAASGVDVLVHPFRIFGQVGLNVPHHLFAPTVDILKRYGMAVEINYHTNEPSAEFFRMCIENDIKLSLGSDAHNLYEVGEFYAHLKFLNKIAPDYNLCDLLID